MNKQVSENIARRVGTVRTYSPGDEISRIIVRASKATPLKTDHFKSILEKLEQFSKDK